MICPARDFAPHNVVNNQIQFLPSNLFTFESDMLKPVDGWLVNRTLEDCRSLVRSLHEKEFLSSSCLTFEICVVANIKIFVWVWQNIEDAGGWFHQNIAASDILRFSSSVAEAFWNVTQMGV